MVFLDKALEKREKEGRPVQVGIVGAGYMGRGMVRQIVTGVEGMRVAAVFNRTISEAERAWQELGIEDSIRVKTVKELEDAIRNGRPVVAEDASILCRAANVDVVIEATGEVEFGAHVVLDAIEHGKHVVLMNAELDATVGPILKVKADRAGVAISNADGDQPGVVMNLLRFVRTIGYRPVLAGNIKGLQDHYRNPETQAGFAAKYRQKPRLITAFADGTKISMEMAVVANATGFRVGVRGMYGPRCSHAKDALNLFPMEQLLEGGLVDYILGAEPSPGVFVLGYNDDPVKRQYMDYFKMGDGPLYVFYTPYHLPHLEGPLTAARLALFQDPAVAPLAGPVADVLTAAKRDLRAGEVLDGIGGFTSYGLIDNHSVCHDGNLLPMGLSEGCRLLRDIPRDGVLSYRDVVLPEGRLCDRLRQEQARYFAASTLRSEAV